MGQDTVKCFDDGDSSIFNYKSNNPNKYGKMNLMHKDLACLSASEEVEFIILSLGRDSWIKNSYNENFKINEVILFVYYF